MSEAGNKEGCERTSASETSPFRRAFDNKEDFIKYYNEHKEDIDKLTTKQLNSAYKIESCKITKIKNKIVVRSETPKDKPKEEKPKDPKPKDPKPKPKPKPQVNPKDLSKMIDSLINHYEKQISQLKEMKNKLVSDELFDSEHDK